MDRSPGGASPSSMNLSTFLGGSSPSPGGGSASNFYQNFASPSAIPASAASSAGSQQYSTSMSIRHEIQRFESVHPSIYAIYDLIELIPDQLLSQQIREHVVCIEGKTCFSESLHFDLCCNLTKMMIKKCKVLEIMTAENLGRDTHSSFV